jgi:hypothetical protein
MRLTLELDAETAEALVRRAVTENRPVAWQAEIELQRALGRAVVERPTHERAARRRGRGRRTPPPEAQP